MREAPRLALFFATSGHSGVDRGLSLLVPALLARGVHVDLLTIRGHGPTIEHEHEHLRRFPLKAGHVYGAIPGLVRYLRRRQPTAVLSGKDRVNRSLALAHALAGSASRLYFRMGTNLAQSLTQRSRVEAALTRLSVRRLYPRARCVLASSAGVAWDLQQRMGADRGRTAILPLPVIETKVFASSFARPAHPWFHDRGPPIVLGVGELSGRKGFDVLLKAFAEVRRQRPCRLMIVGEGAAREPLTRQARALDLGDDLALPGFDPNVYAYMAHADLFAMPSRWEGLGFSLIEALAVGTPAVATDCPSGPRETLQAGRYGPLVAVDDATGLARAIVQTLDQPLAKATLQEAARPFEVARCTDRFIECLGLGG